MDQHTLEIRDKILQSMMSNKQELVKRYGSEAEKIIYGKSMSGAKKQIEAEKQNQIRETIKQCLSRPTQRLMEKKIIDKQGDEWNNDYEEYEKDLTDYKPSQSEIDVFKRDEKGLSPKINYEKGKSTGYATLEVNMGLNDWRPIKYGKIGLINHALKQKKAENPSYAKNYRVTLEYK